MSRTLDSAAYVKANASTIAFEVDTRRMPRAASLSAADIARLDTYLGCGAP